MLEIKNKQTGEVLATIDGDTLSGADMRDMRLAGADLRGADLSRFLIIPTLSAPI